VRFGGCLRDGEVALVAEGPERVEVLAVHLSGSGPHLRMGEERAVTRITNRAQGDGGIIQ
jgi:hypothetical protein